MILNCNILRCFFVVSLLFLCGSMMGEPVFTKKETLYSTKNGSSIGELTLSIEPKSANARNNEWYLIIGDKSNSILSDENKSLWIFSKKVNASSFRRDLRSRDYPLDVRDLSEFAPFCENDIRFDLKEYEEIRKQTQLSFYINASPGEKVTLRLVFYTSTKDKKRTLIEDEAKVRIEFEVPNYAEIAKTKAAEEERELITLNEKIDFEAAAKKREEMAADSVKLVEEEGKEQRVTLLNSFISDRNTEINILNGEVDVLIANKTKVEKLTIDSLETVVDELKKKVDYFEKGYTDILLTDITIHDKFSKFNTTHGITTKKIAELRQQQNPMSGVMKYAQENLIMTIVIAVGGLILMRIFYKLSSKLMSKTRNAISQKIKKMKSGKKDKKQQKAMKEKEKSDAVNDFENIDINDLDQI